MSQAKKSIIIIFVFCFYLTTAFGVSAAGLGFTPTTSTVASGATVTVDVTVDPGTTQIASTDIYLQYDPTHLQIQAVTAGTYFPNVTNVPSTNSLYISGTVSSSGDYKSGKGTVAQVTFKTLKEGSSYVTVTCDLTAPTSTSKIIQNDTNTTNIINCSENGQYSVISSATTGSTASSTSTLPQSGVVDNVIRMAELGGILVLSGLALRVFLRIFEG